MNKVISATKLRSWQDLEHFFHIFEIWTRHIYILASRIFSKSIQNKKELWEKKCCQHYEIAYVLATIYESIKQLRARKNVTGVVLVFTSFDRHVKQFVFPSFRSSIWSRLSLAEADQWENAICPLTGGLLWFCKLLSILLRRLEIQEFIRDLWPLFPLALHLYI